jgi:aryl-alcohol dehydrogenase-like predicted oxidoreductase
MIARLPFGSTGHESSRAVFGAVALDKLSQYEADTVRELLMEFGVNHIDVAASYGDAELRLAPWMREHRADFFLATKTGKRDYEGARQEIRNSLVRMGVEQLDLIQLHNLVDEAEWEQALGPGGALEAAIEAKTQGLVRFIGVTGHGFGAPRRHLASLGRYPFDSVLTPYSWVMCRDPAYAADFEELAAVCQSRGIALVTIKAVARRPWTTARRLPSWYEPLETPEDIGLAVSWVLGRPGIFMATTGNASLLRMVLQAADRAEARPSEARMAMLAETLDMSPIYRGDAALSRP